MKKKISTWFQILVTLLFIGLTHSAQACATCFGKSDSKLAEGMNWGIFTLLVIVVGVLAGISAFFVYIARRSALQKSKVH